MLFNNPYINKTLSQKTIGQLCSQACGVVGGRFWYQVKAINVPDDIFVVPFDFINHITRTKAKCVPKFQDGAAPFLQIFSCD